MDMCFNFNENLILQHPVRIFFIQHEQAPGFVDAFFVELIAATAYPELVSHYFYNRMHIMNRAQHGLNN
jgi:hypothetical protein